MAFLESWKRVGDEVGIEGVDTAENAVCRFAMGNAIDRAQLSMTLFASYWPTPGEEGSALDVLERWLPMDLSSRNQRLPIVGSWILLQQVQGETSRELFERVKAALDARVAAMRSDQRHRPLHSSWED